MGLLDSYYDPQQFADSGGLLGRLLSLQPQYAQYKQAASFDQLPSASPMPAPLSWSTSPGSGQTPPASQPPAPDLLSQYQALRPVLGDYNAMLATVHPEAGKTLIAQALAGEQRTSNASDMSLAPSGPPIVSDASPDPIRPGSQYAQAPLALCAAGPVGCAAGAGLTAGQLILGGGALLGGFGAAMLMHPGDKPESNRLPSPFPGRVTPAPPISLPGVDDWWNENAPARE